MIVLLPKLLVSPDLFGQYAKWLSVCLIGTYFVDFGVSIKALIVAKSNEEESRSYTLFVMCRDVALIVAIAIFSYLLDVEEVMILLASVLGATIFGMQSIYRAKGDYCGELLVNVIQCAVIVAFFCIGYFAKYEIGLNALLFGFLVLPRFLGFLYSTKGWFALLGTWRSNAHALSFSPFADNIRGLIPYAMQGVIVASAANVDVIIASLILPSRAVGEIKVLTTFIGLFVVVPEMVGNYKLNRMANSSASSRDSYWKIFYVLALTISTLSAVFFYFAQPMIASLAPAWWASLCVSIVVALRIISSASANLLTLIGRQARRVWAMLLVNFSYWAGVLALGSFYGEQGFIIALCASSIVQVTIYTYLVTRHE